MNRTPSLAELILVIVALVSALLLFWSHAEQDGATPESSIQLMVKAAGAADLDALRKASTVGYYEDLVGHFGEQKHERVRQIYGQAFQLALPRWYEYRQRAESLSSSAYDRLQERVASLGREAFARLPVEERMKLTEDRNKYADFLFDAGMKALPPEDRKRIDNVEDFRQGRDRHRFVEREGWTLLSAEDRAALGSPAALALANTQEKLNFLSKTGVPLLGPDLRKEIVDIDWQELTSAREFMLKHGRPLAQTFFREAKLALQKVETCRFPREDMQGSLLRGDLARCESTLGVADTTKHLVILLRKDGFDWKVDRVEPDFFEIPEAYPGKKALSRAPAQVPGQAAEVRIPRARWERRSPTEMEDIVTMVFGFARGLLVNPLIWLFFAILFVFVMTWNYLRLRREVFSPELLEGEQQLDELAGWGLGARTHTRLTNRRVLQLRLGWLLSRRKHYAIALADIHSVVWRRYTNWLLLIIGVWLVGKVNPVALLVLLLGLESKIYSVRFNTPVAQMPWTRMAVNTFRRRHFQEFVRFYRKAQVLWARTRTLKESAPAAVATPTPEEDKDFRWGMAVWSYVGLYIVLAVAQRIFERHVSLDDYLFAPLYLGLVIAVAQRKSRDAIWAAILGPVAMLTIKFPGLTPIPGLSFGADGLTPYLEQYFGVMVAFLLMALAASAIAKAINPTLAFMALFLWLAWVAFHKSALALDTSLYGKCALAVVAATVLAWIDRVISWERA